MKTVYIGHNNNMLLCKCCIKFQVSYYERKAENGNHQKVSPYSGGTKNKTAVTPLCDNGEILDYFKVMQGESFICQLCPFAEDFFLCLMIVFTNQSKRNSGFYPCNSFIWISLPKYLSHYYFQVHVDVCLCFKLFRI